MKWTGEKLQALLAVQPEALAFIGADGTERRISARDAAAEIAGGAFTGFGQNGVVWRIVADDAPRLEPFAIFKAVRAAVPRLPHATKNPQAIPDLIGDRPKRVWAPQLRFAHAGLMGKVSTVHLSGGKLTTDVDL
jgi:hypothetical protein